MSEHTDSQPWFAPAPLCATFLGPALLATRVEISGQQTTVKRDLKFTSPCFIPPMAVTMPAQRGVSLK
ncbi:hypothetical protein BU25DRAFT_273943 [Macroventuria anomochaeta]|uniref:Uncharacterized protein n=1 Tax=Macroventuria anomochaeta TaxID=301207 RepID=A0ACB6S6T0_9PLEO|nr:uncharacterized protein BU25DRAFT_273943 [Macroventuria anomochaeta]KAF2629764.1 hypothetical protein BU25DRAFT_273943 [Macroventuria anomochaeta]